MSELVEIAVSAVKKSQNAYCKYISSNDAGKTGTHQSGYYIPKEVGSVWLTTYWGKDVNAERNIIIKWQNNFETSSKIKYYGRGTRNEFRITCFGRGFPFLQDDNVGDILIICQMDTDSFLAFVLHTDNDIEDFMASFNLTSDDTNHFIDKEAAYNPEEKLKELFSQFISLYSDFPQTKEMSGFAMECYAKAWHISDLTIINEPDRLLLNWIEAEYSLFKAFEEKLYAEQLAHPFTSIDEQVKFSNMVLNRRKSRAGKSLEHHLETIFKKNGLIFETQVITEENKKPDFIFPGSKEYHDFLFPVDKLTSLGAKTTCKDRWRQIISEADRIPIKHLFTLQQGISRNQLAEMEKSNVILVVPQPYLKSFDKQWQSKILTLETFTEWIKEKQKK